MYTTKSIIISVSIALLITFIPIALLHYYGPHQITPEDTQKKFFTQNFDSKLKKIYLIGTSHVGQLNVTLINENISKKHPDYIVYNLGSPNDEPSLRLKQLPYIISTHPDLVVYGISYIDFQTAQKDKTILPDLPKYYDHVFFLDKFGNEPINPKFLTLSAIRNFFNISTVFPSDKKIFVPNTPFYYHFDYTITIVGDADIQRDAENSPPAEIDSISNNKEFSSFKQFISELQKNNIKVIVYQTPIKKIYLDKFSKPTQENFNLILNDTSNEFHMKIYDYSSKYEKLPIWMDARHIAYNKNSMIYTQDISSLIMGAIDS